MLDGIGTKYFGLLTIGLALAAACAASDTGNSGGSGGAQAGAIPFGGTMAGTGAVAGTGAAAGTNAGGVGAPVGGTGAAGVAAGGVGASGTGAAGVGASGTGVAGVGASGTGVAGVGASGTGVAGVGASGTGAAGTGAAGTGTAGTTSGAPDDTAMAQCLQMAADMGRSEACAQCTCTTCFDQADEVYNNTDANFAAQAQAIISCGDAACCKSTDCFCGEGAVANALLCVIPGPMGACMAEINAGAGLPESNIDAIMVSTLCDVNSGTMPCAAAARLGDCIQGDGVNTFGNCTECVSCQ